MPDFDDFFLKEYDRISEAYFKTGASISEFMKHYLTIMSIPPALVVIFGKPESLVVLRSMGENHPFAAALPLVAVGLVGFCLCSYLVAQSLNARLYSRAVNGIRDHFLSKLAGDQLVAAQRCLVLPTETNKPSFRTGTITHVLWAMATVDAAYIAAGLFVFQVLSGRWKANPMMWGICVSLLFAVVFSLHFALRSSLAKRMEAAWSTSPNQPSGTPRAPAAQAKQ